MFKLSTAAQAAGVPAHTFAAWVDRSLLLLDSRDEDSAGSGNHRSFCKARVMQAALANSLQRVGIGALRACDAASVFANESQPGRAAGELFRDGRTLLIVSQTESKVINSQTALNDIAEAVVIDCGVVAKRVDLALGAGMRPRARAAA